MGWGGQGVSHRNACGAYVFWVLCSYECLDCSLYNVSSRVELDPAVGKVLSIGRLLAIEALRR